LFEVVILANLSVLDYLKNYMKVRRSEKVIHPEASYHRTSQLFVEPEEGSLTIVEADGEIAGRAPIVYTCLPGALRFLVP